jgi:hypothetical protein
MLDAPLVHHDDGVRHRERLFLVVGDAKMKVMPSSLLHALELELHFFSEF